MNTFTDKQAKLLEWLFSNDQTTQMLRDENITELDVMIDPDTTKDDDFVGVIGQFVKGDKLILAVKEEVKHLKEKSMWDGKTTYLFYLPLFDRHNSMVASFWDPVNPCLMGSCTMIHLDKLDKLISDAGLVKEYLTGVQSQANDQAILRYDLEFAEQHRLPIYNLHMDPISKIYHDGYKDACDVIAFFYDLVLAIFAHYLPSNFICPHVPKYTYTPSSDEVVVGVDNFALVKKGE